MNLRMRANLVVLLSSWVLWEKWIAHNLKPSVRLVQGCAEDQNAHGMSCGVSGFCESTSKPIQEHL